MAREYVADTETITRDGVECVWLWALRVVSTDERDKNVKIGTEISDFIDTVDKVCEPRASVWMHNLKFDGAFIVTYLLQNDYTWRNCKPDKLKKFEFTTNVSFMGATYSISFRKNKLIHFRDSLKLFQASEEKLAEDYKLPIQKGKIDYKKERPQGYKPQEYEIQYILDDVFIIAYVLSKFRNDGYKKNTIAGSALYQFVTRAFPTKGKNGKPNYYYSLQRFKDKHPITYEQDTDIRKAYHGGISWVNPLYINKVIGDGRVYDVNSMYPAVMYNELMPYGHPIYYKGKYEFNRYQPLYIQHIKVSFETKDKCIPIVQNKGRMILHKFAREYLTTTEIGKNKHQTLDLWLSSVDLEILINTSNILYIEYIEGYKFKAKRGGFFRDYIDYFKGLKDEGKKEKNASKTMFAKYHLNSLYGKFCSKPFNFVMRPILENGKVKYIEEGKEDADLLYSPLGVFITSYARRILTTAINNNFDRFCYCDTDSIHLLGDYDPQGIEVDKLKLGAWDNEMTFKRAKYLGSKKYIEEKQDGTLIVKCAGLGKLSSDNIPGAENKITFDNFSYGTVFSVLKCKTVEGGKIIDTTPYEIKPPHK